MTQVCRFMSAPPVYCLILLGLVASWAFAADPAAKAQEMLASSHPNAWLEAVEQLAAAEQVSTLIQLLREDPRKLVRTAAALLLPLFQEERVIAALSQALDDQEKWVRLASIEALAFLGGGARARSPPAGRQGSGSGGEKNRRRGAGALEVG